MAQNVKAKKVKQKKKQPNKAWQAIWQGTKTLFLSLFSNQTCVDQKDKKWYWAIPLGIISCVLAVVPLGVSQWNQSGSQLLDSPTYSVENGLIGFQEALSKNNVDVMIDATNHTAAINPGAWNAAFPDYGNTYSYRYDKTVTYFKTDTVIDSNSQSSTTEVGPAETRVEHFCDLTVYNCTALAGGVSLNEYVTTTLSNSDVLGNTTYSVNALFLGKNQFVFVKAPSGAKTAQAKVIGQYDGASFNMKYLVKQDSHGNAYDVSYSQLTNGNYSIYLANSVSAWKLFFADAWNSSRIANGWRVSGIWLGVYVGMTMIYGFLIWLMTRGKDNPYRSYTLWQTQKIAYWAALCPAILSLILGFMWSAYIQMYFIFLFGFRVMWMSMKTLRPYQA